MFDRSRLSSIPIACVFVLAACRGKNERPGSPAEDTSRNSPKFVYTCEIDRQLMCLQDTAYLKQEPGDPYESATANWIWFAAAGDSLDMSTFPAASLRTSLGRQHDARGNDANRFGHPGLSDDGVVVASISHDASGHSDTVIYDLVIRRKRGESSPPLQPTGQWARILVASTSIADSFSIVPLSAVPAVRDRSKWQVRAQDYNVILVRDSVYQVCRVPCLSPLTVTLTPGSRVAVKF